MDDGGKGSWRVRGEQGYAGMIDESVPRSIQTVRVALAAQATRWERSPGVAGSALLQLVQGKAMKSRQMGNNVKLIWLVAIWAAPSKYDWIAALSGEIGCRLPKTEWGTPTGARNETFGGLSQLVRSVARLGPWS